MHGHSEPLSYQHLRSRQKHSILPIADFLVVLGVQASVPEAPSCHRDITEAHQLEPGFVSFALYPLPVLIGCA